MSVLRIDKNKSYKVKLSRMVAETIELEVEAKSIEQAEESAMWVLENDFECEWESVASDNEPQITSVEEL